MPGPHIRLQSATLLRRTAAILAVTASSLAAAQAVPTIGGGANEKTAEHAPYFGSAISYGHQLTAYNPTPEVTAWSQRLGLMPEFHFSKVAFVRGRFYMSQELTLSDSTTYKHEIELSDLWLDGVWTGYTEKNSGIRLAGDLRVTLPTSKTSQAASRLFTLGPSLNLSRHFKVLGGLTFIYSGRFTWRFNRFSTRQNLGGQIINCPNIGVPEQCVNTATGARNVQADVLHGPTISFSPHEKLNISATFLMQHAWLSPLSAVPAEFANIPELATNSGPQARDFNAFSLGVTFQPVDMVGLTLGAFSFQNQLDTTGQYIFPLFNRNTVVSLDVSLDIEAAVTSLTKEKS